MQFRGYLEPNVAPVVKRLSACIVPLLKPGCSPDPILKMGFMMDGLGVKTPGFYPSTGRVEGPYGR